MSRLRIAVIGAGNGGLAVAGVCASKKHHVTLWNRENSRFLSIRKTGLVELSGAVRGEHVVNFVCGDIADAVVDADVIFVVVTADAHAEIATRMSKSLNQNQVVILTPGRTGGTLEFTNRLKSVGCEKLPVVAETQTLMYACRADGNRVNILAEKAHVPIATNPANTIVGHIDLLSSIFPALDASPSVVHTGLENIGAIFHPAITLFNASLIDRGGKGFFYRDMSSSIASVLQRLDKERLAIGEAIGISLNSIFEWIKIAYPDTVGHTLHERMQNSIAYREIEMPRTLRSRQLIEDLSTGLVPMCAWASLIGVEVPIMTSIIHLGGSLLNIDFWTCGRTLDKMGTLSLQDLKQLASQDVS